MSYIGNSMSVRASEAYSQGEKPLSKFNKEDVNIVKRFLTENSLIPEDLEIKVYHLKEFLEDCGRSSWHHTGKYFNETDFYSFAYAISDGYDADLDYIKKENVDQDRLNEFIEIIQTKRERKKATKVSQVDKEKDYYFADVSYEEWEGSRRYPKLRSYTDQALIYGNYAYLLGVYKKKRLSGSHFYIDKAYTNRKPKSFNTQDVSIIRKKLHLK